MLYSSLAVLALAASSALPPTADSVPTHSERQQDTRVNLYLYNPTSSFRDVKIGGATYTVLAHDHINVKAPAGTVIYADSFMYRHHRGDALLSISPADNNTRVVLD